MKTKKKIIIIVVVMAVVFVGATFGFFALKKNARSKKTVNVFPMMDVGMSGEYYYDYDSMMDGYVTTDKEQNIYLSSGDKIKEVFVQEGDLVHAGDVLLEYDTTVQSLKLQSLRANAEVARTDILAAQRQLTKLQNTIPIEDIPEPTTEAPTTEQPTTEAPTTEQPTTGDTITTPTDANAENNPTEGSSTEGDSTEGGSTEGSSTENNPIEEKPVDSFAESDSEIEEDSYTRAELEQAIKYKKQEIESLKITYQLKLLDLEIEEKKSANGQVVASFDGVVKTRLDEDTAIIDNAPFITISGSDGYAVHSSIGELSLGKYHIGDKVFLNCYDNGMSYTGTISEIATTPSDNYYYSSKVQSYYDVIILVEETEDLKPGMYMEIQYDGSDVSEEGYDYYIPLAFVQKENGQYYVMKDVDGVLKKEYVKTGDVIYGDMIAIIAGVTMDDYLALPTAKNAKEGIKTVQKDVNTLYGY